MWRAVRRGGTDRWRWRRALVAVLTAASVLPVAVATATAPPAAAAPGDLDPSYGAGGIAAIDVGERVTVSEQTAVDPQGRLVVTGTTDAGDVFVARFTADGQADEAWGTGGVVRFVLGDPGVFGRARPSLAIVDGDVYVGYGDPDADVGHVIRLRKLAGTDGTQLFDEFVRPGNSVAVVEITGSDPVAVVTSRAGTVSLSTVSSDGSTGPETDLVVSGLDGGDVTDAAHRVLTTASAQVFATVTDGSRAWLVEFPTASTTIPAPEPSAVLAGCTTLDTVTTSFAAPAVVAAGTRLAGCGSGASAEPWLQPAQADLTLGPAQALAPAPGVVTWDSVDRDDDGRLVGVEVSGATLSAARLDPTVEPFEYDPTFGTGGQVQVSLGCESDGQGGVVAADGRITVATACGTEVLGIRLQGAEAAAVDITALDVVPPELDAATLALDLETVDRAEVLGDVSLASVLASPLRFSPLRFSPLRFSPLRFSTLGTEPQEAPLRFSPLRFSALGSLSVPVPLTEIPVEREGGWPAVLAELPGLAGRVPQNVTIQEVIAELQADAPPALEDLNLGQIDLTDSPLATSSVIALLLGDVPLSALPSGLCVGCDGTRTIADLEVSGGDLGDLYERLAATPLDSTGLVDPDGSTDPSVAPLRFSPLRFSPLRFSSLADSALGELTVAEVPAAFACSSCDSGLTLSEAQAAGQLADISVGELLDLLDGLELGLGLTVGDLILAFVPGDDFPWEEVPLERLHELQGPAAGADVSVEVAVTCAGGQRLQVDVALPDGIVPPAEVDVAVDGTASTSAVTVDGQQLVVESSDGCTGEPATVLVELPAVPGPGAALQGITAAARVLDGATPVTDDDLATATVRTADADAGDAGEPIDEDVLYSSYLAEPGDVDYFTFTPAAVDGAEVEVLLSHLPEDLDLVVYGPQDVATTSSAPLRFSPLRFSPLRFSPLSNAPVEDEGATRDQAFDATPETLEDIPLRFSSFRQSSINRGTDDEVVRFRLTADDVVAGGEFTIQVSGYNDVSSPQPYVLRVKTTSPLADLECIERDYPTGSWTTADGPIPTVPADTETLILHAPQRLERVHADEVTDVTAALETYAGRDEVRGAILAVDDDPDVQAAYDAWDEPAGDPVTQGPCSVAAANGVVREINGLVEDVVAENDLQGLRHVVLVGGDEVIPSGRVLDEASIANQQSYRYDAAVGRRDNPVSRAYARGYLLTDDAYGDFDPSPFLGDALYLPDLGVGRLVESPAQILRQLTAYEQADGRLSLDSSQTFAYDFLADGGDAVAAALAARSPADSDTTDEWDRADVLAELSAPAPAQSLNAHFDHRRLLPAAPDAAGSFGETDLVSTSDLAGVTGIELLFSMGCNAGVSLADGFVGFGDPTDTDPTVVDDWADVLAGIDATSVLNRGFGYGDSDVVAYGERLHALFAERLDGSVTVSQALTLAKHAYLRELGQSGPYDAKTVHIASYYGLPTYRIGDDGGVGPSFVPPEPVTGPDTAVESAPFDVDFSSDGPNPVVEGADGVYAIDGQPLVTVQNRPIQPAHLTDLDPPQSDKTAHGVLITDLESSDEPATPVIATPTVDLGAIEPEVELAEAHFPSTLWNLTRTAATGTVGDTLVLMPGAYFEEPDGTSGVQRIWTRMAGEVLFSDGGDREAPTIRSVRAIESADATAATFFARTDETATRAVVLYRLQGEAVWQDLELAGGPTAWTGSVSAPGGSSTPVVAEAFVQVPDDAGNVGVASFKGRYYESVAPPPGGAGPNGETLVADPPVPDDPGYLAGPTTVRVEDGAPGEVYEIEVDGQAAGPAPVMIDTDGVHTATVTWPDERQSSIEVPVDLAPPTITYSLSGEQGPGGWFRSDVTISFTCDDTVSGVASCSDAVSVDDEGEHGPIVGVAVDGAGWQAQVVVPVPKIDHTEPTVSDVAVSPSAKAIGESAIVSASVGDDLSGVGAAEYVLDVTEDPGEGAGVPMLVSDGTATVTLGTDIAPGVYELGVRALDAAGNWSPLSTAFLVVYDPDGAFVTGGGWIIPDPSNDVLPGLDAGDTDKAHFGFSVRYRSGASTVPSGNASFRYRAGDLDLRSDRFDWLVVTTPNAAIFQGLADVTHPVGGQLVTQVLPFRMDVRQEKQGVDEFGIKIYAEGADPDRDDPVYRVKRAPVGGGSIQVQTSGGGR